MSLSLKNRTINRELSWLSFNHRVLQEAQDSAVPLIERMRFLGIFSNNLDEFFRVRVATMKRIEAISPKKKSLSGAKTASEIIDEISDEVVRQKEIFAETYNEIIKKLEGENIYMVDEKNLFDDQKEFVDEYYRERVAPLLVPIMLKSISEFPYLRDKSIYLAVKLSVRLQKKQYAIIEVPSEQSSRFVVLPERQGRKYIMFLDDVIRFNFDKIFGLFEYTDIQAHTMKITRDAELDMDDDVSKGIYEKVKKSIKQRTKGQPVRFVHDREMPKDLLKYLRGKLEIDEDDDNIIPGGRYHNSKDFMKFPNVGKQSLEWDKLVQLEHPLLKRSRSILSAVEKNDILLHYPYNHFRNFVHFLRESAIHPEVKEIKISLYRVASQSRVINALISAVKNGKNVTAMVELRARFDEENNLNWAKQLQDAGVKVIFGIPDIKVHCKLALVTRVADGKVTNYSVISTGNFNEATGKVYTDFALFTAHQEICDEVLNVFSFIERPYRNFRFKHLIVAPASMRNHYIREINKEIRHAKDGKKASIFIKVNSLVDENLIRKLYQASRAGVEIRIIVRGICSLIPGIAGVSENIEVRSIVDRFLEHSRVFIFHNTGNENIYISSADWMTRNLDFRIEVSAGIYDPFVRKQITDFMELQWSDNTKARVIDQQQKNTYVKPKKSAPSIRSQFDLFERMREDYERLT